MKLTTLIACLAAAPLLLAAAPEPVRLKPSSPWIVDYAENSCRLIRNFAEGKDKTVLVFESPSPGSMSMLAIGRPLGTSREEVTARFLPLEHEPIKGVSATSTTSRQPAVHWLTVPLVPDALAALERARIEENARSRVRPPPIDLNQRAAIRAARRAFAAAVNALEIGTRRNRPVILETGSLGKPMEMFDKCTRDSLRDWGVDPDLEEKIVRPVWTPDASRWFSADDYPRDMLRQGQQSELRARLLVDATGKVTKCTSLSHFDAPAFNKLVCDKLMSRGRFEPAELADGTKVPSYYTIGFKFIVQ